MWRGSPFVCNDEMISPNLRVTEGLELITNNFAMIVIIFLEYFYANLLKLP